MPKLRLEEPCTLQEWANTGNLSAQSLTEKDEALQQNQQLVSGSSEPLINIAYMCLQEMLKPDHIYTTPTPMHAHLYGFVGQATPTS